MSSRSRSRQFAVQVLYQLELTGDPLESVLNQFWSREDADGKTRAFSERLVEGVIDQGHVLDLEIVAYAKNWSLERMAIVDRIILRIAIFEMIQLEETPWKVVADESATLALMFSSMQSMTFINGILHAWGTHNREEVVR